MIKHESEIVSQPVYGEGISKVAKQILAGPQDGFNGFLRQFTLDSGGHTPYHRHDWYHLVYMVQGTGLLKYEDREHPLSKGTVAYVEANKIHSFSNTGKEAMKFLCLVPQQGDRYS